MFWPMHKFSFLVNVEKINWSPLIWQISLDTEFAIPNRHIVSYSKEILLVSNVNKYLQIVNVNSKQVS